MNLLEAARIWASKGFIDDATLDARNSSIKFFRGPRIVSAYQDGSRLVVEEGDVARVFDGIASADRPIIVAKILSSGNSPENEFSHLFETLPYDKKFADCVLYPEDVISSGAIYKDHGGRRYIHSGNEGKVSLLFYKGLYDRNREYEMIALPELRPYTGEVFSSKLSFLTDETALNSTVALFDLEPIEAVNKRSIPSRKCMPSVLARPSSVLSFKEVLSDSDALFLTQNRQEAVWSDVKKKYNLRNDLIMSSKIYFYSL